MRTSEIYISDCKKYIAFKVLPALDESISAGGIDVIDNKGNYWAYFPNAKRNYPLRREIGNYSSDNDKHIIKIELLTCNNSKKIILGSSNTVIRRTMVLFKRKITYKSLPRWAKAMSELLKVTRNLSW